MPEDKTDFSGLASATQVAYSAVSNADDATQRGEYKQTNEGLRKPFRLEWPNLVRVKPLFR
jgi:hypothetical protein